MILKWAAPPQGQPILIGTSCLNFYANLKPGDFEMDRIVKMFMLATLVVGFLMTQCGAEEMEVPGSVAQDSAIPKTSSGNFHEWKSAQQYTYALNLQNTTATSSGETLMEIALEGNLKMVPFDVEGGGTKIYFELEQHKVDTRDESQASDMETLETVSYTI